MLGLKLSPLYTDGMIFQRERPVPIEGEAFGACTVTATLDGDSVTERVAAGRFTLSLPPRAAGRGLTLTVSAGGEEIVLRDIYVGEVWLAGGQSNMAWSLADTEEYKHQPVKANADLRFFTVGRNIAAAGGYDSGYEWAHCADFGWVGCDADTATCFSAVAYHFAQTLYGALDVPIGIINCNVGGSSIYSWLPKEEFLSNPDIRYKWTEWENILRTLDADDAHDRYYRFLDENRQQFDISKNISGTSRELPLIYFNEPGPYNYQRPSALYEPMLERVIRFPAHGMIWYQGETDTDPEGSKVYAFALSSLVHNLKKHQGYSSAYGFHLVQLAPWNEPGAIYWADVCDQQRRFFVEHPQYGMVTIGDLGGGTDIHPPRKQKVGERLAYAALDRNYQMPCEFTGPVAVSAKREGREIRVGFIHAAGLHLQGVLGRFELVDANGKPHPAPAALRFGAVYVELVIENPLFVRYEYVCEPKIGLYNEAGIPASVFSIPVE